MSTHRMTLVLALHPATEPPDDDTTVLVMLDGDDEPSWLGYHTVDEWHTVEGLPFFGRVTAWAHLPGAADVMTNRQQDDAKPTEAPHRPPTQVICFWSDGTSQYMDFDHWPDRNELPADAVRFDMAVPARKASDRRTQRQEIQR